MSREHQFTGHYLYGYCRGITLLLVPQLLEQPQRPSSSYDE